MALDDRATNGIHVLQAGRGMKSFEGQQQQYIPEPEGIHVPVWAAILIPVWFLVSFALGVGLQLYWLIGILS